MSPLHCLKTITKSNKDAFIPWNKTKALIAPRLHFRYYLQKSELPDCHISTHPKKEKAYRKFVILLKYFADNAAASYEDFIQRLICEPEKLPILDEPSNSSNTPSIL